MRWSAVRPALLLAGLLATSACHCHGTPTPRCSPSCTGLRCGDDGCGGSCGACTAPAATCLDGRTLRTFAASTCVAGRCAAEPTDTTCGRCADGTCSACVPACDGKGCGDDGCGGSCGECPASRPTECVGGNVERTFGAGSCAAGQCVWATTDRSCTSCANGRCEGCVSDCTVKRCGDDGCGGSCGECASAPYRACLDRRTLRQYAAPGSCDPDGSCVYPGTDTSCPGGACTGDIFGECRSCSPSCSDSCSDDGCGGACPDCGARTCGGDGALSCGTTRPTFPGAAPRPVAAKAPSSVVISPDERHVAMLRGPPDTRPGICNNLNLYPARASLEVATVPATGAATTLSVTSSVAISSALGPRFSADGQWLLFADGTSSACQRAAQLRLANADGSNARLVAIDVFWFAVAGQTVAWISKLPVERSARLWARHLPDGAAVLLASDVSENYALPDPTGAAVAYKRLDDTFALVHTAGGAPVQLAPAGGVRFGYGQWSHSGDRLAFVQYPKLSVATREGGAVEDVAAALSGPFVFSPDDRRLAYAVHNARGGVDVGVRELAAKTEVRLTDVAEALGSLSDGAVAFSPSGDWLYVLARPGAVGALSAARSNASGAFGLLARATNGFISYAASPADDYVVATLSGPSEVRLVPLGAGAARTLLPEGGTAVFEARRTSPRFAIFDTIGASGALEVMSSDGTGRLFAPGVVYNHAPDGAPAQRVWYGRTLLYPSSPRFDPQHVSSTTFDLHAITDDGAKSGVLAREVGWWKAAEVDVPTRVFFATGAVAGAGLYVVDVAQP